MKCLFVPAKLLNKLFQSLTSLNDILIAIREGHPDIMITFRPEYIARNKGNFCVLKEQRCEFLPGHAEFFNVDEDIECTFRTAAA